MALRWSKALAAAALLGSGALFAAEGEDSTAPVLLRSQVAHEIDDAPSPFAAEDEMAPLPPTESSAETPADSGVEVITERFPNGRPRIVREVTQDEYKNYYNHGAWAMLDQAGSRVAWGDYRMGQRHGPWTRIYSSAQELKVDLQNVRGFEPPFTSQANFDSGNLVGEWTIHDAQGRPVESWPFEDGQVHGMVVRFHANGDTRSEGFYEKGVPTGVAKRYDGQGKVIGTETFVKGRLVIPLNKKSRNGQPEMTGAHLAATAQVNTTGDWWNGTIQPETVQVQDREVRHGSWTQFHPNGLTRFAGEYKEGQAVGTHTWWYSNGQMQAQGQFNQGKQGGVWVWWHQNGQKMEEGKFDNGAPVESWIRWNEDGKVTSTQEESGLEASAPADEAAAEPMEDSVLFGETRRVTLIACQPVNPPAGGSLEPTE